MAVSFLAGGNLENGSVSSHNGEAKSNADSSRLGAVIKNELSKQSSHSFTLKLIGLNIGGISDYEVELLYGVERLSLRRNRLSSLPMKFCLAESLRYLDLNGNEFNEIPQVLQQCPQLEILDLSSNKIEYLPKEISPLWAKNLKVLSLKNNKLTRIRALFPIVYLTHLSVIEIEGNMFPKEELDLITSHTPMTSNVTREEYWAIALRRYFKDHAVKFSSEIASSPSTTKITKAAKRMGFINSLSPSNSTIGDNIDALTLNESVLAGSTVESEREVASVNISHQNDNDAQASNNELYNHTKYNDYFKRLSVLQEESPANSEVTVGHDELVLSCRKLLFSFTECQQNIRRMTSFCKEKSIAMNVISLLYSVRSHIDNLVEMLEKSETDGQSHDKALIKLCVTVIEIFKQIVSILAKNFRVFFEANDLCFIRMFYMTMLTSYSEIYNAWCFISPESFKKQRKLSNITRAHTAVGLHTTIVDPPPKHSARIISNPLQTRPSLSSVPQTLAVSSGNPGHSPGLTMTTPNSSFWGSGPPRQLNSTQSTGSQTSSFDLRQPSPNVKTISLEQKHGDNSKSNSDNSYMSLSSLASNTIAGASRVGVSSLPINSSSSGLLNANILTPTAPPTPSSSSRDDKDIDKQLHQTLLTVVNMVSVVYDQLTSAISQTAMASTKGQLELTESLTLKIHDLADTCRQSMELSKTLSIRLQSLLSADGLTTGLYSSDVEKLQTWETVNAFLKSIIQILGNTKIVMAEMPILNEIRPNLASLAKITKDVTVILDLSSYKAISIGSQQVQSLDETKVKKYEDSDLVTNSHNSPSNLYI